MTARPAPASPCPNTSTPPQTQTLATLPDLPLETITTHLSFTDVLNLTLTHKALFLALARIFNIRKWADNPVTATIGANTQQEEEEWADDNDGQWGLSDVEQHVLVSQHSDQPITIRVLNSSRETVDVLWLNYQGEEIWYNTLAPGTDYVQQTYLTHPWRVRPTDGTCYMTLHPPDGSVVDIPDFTPDIDSITNFGNAGLEVADLTDPTTPPVQWNVPAAAFTQNAHHIRRVRLQVRSPVFHPSQITPLANAARYAHHTFPRITHLEFALPALFPEFFTNHIRSRQFQSNNHRSSVTSIISLVESLTTLRTLKFTCTDAAMNLHEEDPLKLMRENFATKRLYHHYTAFKDWRAPALVNAIISVASPQLQNLIVSGVEELDVSLLRRFTSLTHLRVPDTHPLTRDLFRAIADTCPHLTSLNFSNDVVEVSPTSPLNVDTVRGLLSFPHLTEFTVRGRCARPMSMAALLSIVFGRNRDPRLETLCIERCVDVEAGEPGERGPVTVRPPIRPFNHTLPIPLGNRVLQVPLKSDGRPSGLTELVLSDVTLSSETYTILSSGYLPHLRILRLATYFGNISPGQLSVTHIHGFLTHAKGLERLELDFSEPDSPHTHPHTLTLFTLHLIATLAKNLRHLTFSIPGVTKHITHRAVLRVVDGCPLLSTFVGGERNWDVAGLRKVVRQVRERGGTEEEVVEAIGRGGW
ncbi:hypothetical protein HK104_000542 [Borealophlyctis nickersoniae]|nr:hypothetical protein HK104_000542 [Borealophlyctis nickersoniae]